MRKKNKVILALVVLAAVLFGVIQFGVIPAQHRRQAAYDKAQTDALTHDITSIEAFKSPYMGDASNTGALFYHLPLGNLPMTFQLDDQDCSLTVNYGDSVWHIGEEAALRDLVYNSVAAMASIDNLTAVTYNFSGESYSFSRKRVESVFGAPLSDLLERDVWEEEVRDRLGSDDFITALCGADLN